MPYRTSSRTRSRRHMSVSLGILEQRSDQVGISTDSKIKSALNSVNVFKTFMKHGRSNSSKIASMRDPESSCRPISISCDLSLLLLQLASHSCKALKARTKSHP